MIHKIRHGAEIEVATPGEIAALLANQTMHNRKRVRAMMTQALDAAGHALFDVYKVPSGMEFEARRIVLDLNSAADPSAGNINLQNPGVFVRYLRSGARIGYANPSTPHGSAAIPGTESWGEQQGPVLRTQEVFQIEAQAAGAAGSVLSVLLEGYQIDRHKDR